MRCWFRSGLCLLLSVALTTIGCEQHTAYSEVKRMGDSVSAREIDAFLAVVESLPEHRLPKLTGAVATSPRWNSGRTLPVRELLHEERKMLRTWLTVEAVMAQLPQPKNLSRVLRRESLTFEQFAGLVVVLGAALNRTAVTNEAMLDTILQQGVQPLLALEHDARVFSSLSDEHEFLVLDQASWIPAVERAEWLMLVPPENIALARKYRERLQAVFPTDFSADPFAQFSRLLQDEGTPFHERPESGTDELIPWTSANRS